MGHLSSAGDMLCCSKIIIKTKKTLISKVQIFVPLVYSAFYINHNSSILFFSLIYSRPQIKSLISCISWSINVSGTEYTRQLKNNTIGPDRALRSLRGWSQKHSMSIERQLLSWDSNWRETGSAWIHADQNLAEGAWQTVQELLHLSQR